MTDEETNFIQLSYDFEMLGLQRKSTACIQAKVIADSVNPGRHRLTTFDLTFPRSVLAELSKHRAFSFNTASSRAVPIGRMQKAVSETPFIPMVFQKNQAGMQGGEESSLEDVVSGVSEIASLSRQAIEGVERLQALGFHKQIVNRYLEPFSFCQVVLSTTSFKHYELLRDSAMAEPHIRYLAQLMASVRSRSVPEALKLGEWHLPLITEEDRSQLNLDDLKRVSVARCAAVSYVRHNEKREYDKDFTLYDRLKDSGHWTPFEHVATPHGIQTWCPLERGVLYPEREYTWDSLQSGNFYGWNQHRKEFQNEFVPDEPYVGESR